ncbi:MAG: Tll0287-like domain-containing protein [Planctomycetota bacterium]|jgi:general secretion pathway protein A
MLRRLIRSGLVLLLVAGMSSAHVFAESDKDLEKRADLAAKFLVSCRAIIAQNQGLFNNPEIGDKGFTSDVYASKVKKHFKDATGVDVSEDDASSADHTKKILGVLLVSSKTVIDESQKVLNQKGRGFKKVIPAIVGRRTGYKYNKTMGKGYNLKQTSLKFRNPANHPDAFEKNILEEFEAKGYPKGKGKGEIVDNNDGSQTYRYMLPLYINSACLQCHGDPMGERDIARKIKEGYKEGEIRGAISLKIPYSSEKVTKSE